MSGTHSMYGRRGEMHTRFWWKLFEEIPPEHLGLEKRVVSATKAMYV